MVGVMEINHLVSSCVQITHKYITKILPPVAPPALSIQKLIFTKDFPTNFRSVRERKRALMLAPLVVRVLGVLAKLPTCTLEGEIMERKGGGGGGGEG